MTFVCTEGFSFYSKKQKQWGEQGNHDHFIALGKRSQCCSIHFRSTFLARGFCARRTRRSIDMFTFPAQFARSARKSFLRKTSQISMAWPSAPQVSSRHNDRCGRSTDDSSSQILPLLLTSAIFITLSIKMHISLQMAIISIFRLPLLKFSIRPYSASFAS